MVPHFRFAREHQRYIKKIAVVTDSLLGDVVEHLASHFVSAQMHHFPAGDIERARRWIGEERRHRRRQAERRRAERERPQVR